jgi:hypothetical protein
MPAESSGKSPPRDANQCDHPKPSASGKDLVEALANSPLKDVPIERASVKVRVRTVKL